MENRGKIEMIKNKYPVGTRIKLNYMDDNYSVPRGTCGTVEYVDDEIIKKYRKQIQCFRHSSNNALEERKQFSDEEKEFIIDYGITIIKLIYSFK